MSPRSRDAHPQEPGETPRLAVTSGDPCGIGPEIVLKALQRDDVTAAARIVVIGDEPTLRKTARDLKIRWPFASVVARGDAPADSSSNRPLLIDVGERDDDRIPGQVSASAGRAAGQAIEEGVRLALEGVVEGLVTAPIHKEALSLAGYSDPGHTEMLGRLAGSRRVGMLFWSETLRVALLTTHMSLREAVRRVRKGRVSAMLTFLDREWKKLDDKRPHIAVAALNPHGGEGGRFGTEEIHHLVPAIESARGRGIVVSGPVPADSVFSRAIDGAYDVVLALYHDQGTIPVKTVCGRSAVNVTLGLPFVRTSVDHGTAMDIAGKGIASEESLALAIDVAARFAMRRRTPRRKKVPAAGS